MSSKDANSSFERIVAQISVALASLVFAMQMINAGSLPTAITKAFVAGVAVMMILLGAKVAFVMALKYGRRPANTSGSGTDSEQDTKDIRASKEDSPSDRSSKRMAA
ncbi:MAG: hypothetical protein HKN13_14045 [Rhodothermales bacterium]|nr:hypothetical protein [Rhodothermales bacterium]